MRGKIHRITRLQIACIAGALAASPLAFAAGYSDTTGDQWSSAYVDLTGATISNDATNLHVTVNVGPTANLLDAGQQFGIYELGLHKGPGGQTQINQDFSGGVNSGNPYGNPVGISSGENTFVAMYTNGGGGFDAYTYNSATGWTRNASAFQDPTKLSLTATSLNLTVPLAALGLNPGDTFNFDIWSTFSGANSAYDALDNPSQTFSGSSRLPYQNGSTPPAPYDSATETPSAFAATTYTVVVPEPGAIASIAVLGAAMFCGRRHTARGTATRD